MKIIAYIRVSTSMQVESGLGLEAQRQACEKYAKASGTVLSEIFKDEGLSGALSIEKRPGILAALSCITKNDVLVVAKRDRLGRDPIVVAMIEAALKRKGAKVVSVSGEGTDDDQPTSILMRRIVDALSEYERLVIGGRVKAAMQIKKSRGERVGRIPFGYKMSDDNFHIVKDDFEQAILHQIFFLKNQGKSIRRVVSELNEHEFLNRGGVRWNHASLHRIMTNNCVKLANLVQ